VRHIMQAVLVAVLVCCLFVSSFGRERRTWVGVSSWYGRREAGKEMANGHRFDPSKLTAASRTLPFGTRLRVTFLRTRRTVIVTVTDRGPFVPPRILDLSEAAAKAIGLRPYGVGLVKIERL
jgi:rare lipoprotein A